MVDTVHQTLNRIGGCPQALFLKLHHLVGKAHAFLADAKALRHPHIVKMDHAGVAGHHADLADFFGASDTRHVHGHNDEAFVFVCGPFAGVGQQAHPIGLQAVGDPHLAAVDDVVATVFACCGFDG